MVTHPAFPRFARHVAGRVLVGRRTDVTKLPTCASRQLPFPISHSPQPPPAQLTIAEIRFDVDRLLRRARTQDADPTKDRADEAPLRRRRRRRPIPARPQHEV